MNREAATGNPRSFRLARTSRKRKRGSIQLQRQSRKPEGSLFVASRDATAFTYG